MERRRFLKGVGGALLALPVLPSLFKTSPAYADVGNSKCFVHFRTPHGGVWNANMWPADSALTQTVQYNHAVRRGALAASTAGGDASISPVLTAKSSVLTPALVAKMNILRGLDITTDMAHNFGGSLGYYDKNKEIPAEPRATIDQIMAYSTAFYPSVASVRRRSVAISKTNSGIYGYRTPGVASSGVSNNAIGGTESSQGLFDTLLGGVASTPSPGGAPRPPVVDQVLESYKRLRDGNKRLSQEDKLRLDQHMQAVAEVQRRLKAPLAAGCQVPVRPTSDNLALRPMDGNPTRNVEFFRLMNEVLAIAINCGSTRIVTFGIDENPMGLTFTSRPAQGEDWHQNVAHVASEGGTAQALIKEFNRTFFSGVFMDLVSRLDNFSDGAGKTLLDHCLVAWGQESGNVTHLPFSMPVITAGSAGGAIKTGNYCDYRNLSRRLSGDSTTGTESLWPGLLYNQWLSTALLAMGIPKSEWSESSHGGYGARPTFDTGSYFFTNNGFTQAQVYTDAMWQKTGELLPFLA